MEKVYSLKYPWLRGYVLADLGSAKLVKWLSGAIIREKVADLGTGWLLVEMEDGLLEVPRVWLDQFRKAATDEVKDEVVDKEVGDV